MSERFLTAVGETGEVEKYLGFGARIVETLGERRRSHVVAIDEENAAWLSARFGSGLRGGRIFEDKFEAIRDAELYE